MTVTTRTADVFEVSGGEGLDAVTIILQDFALGKGRVTLECWGNAWSCYFGGMGGNTIREFFLSSGTEYLVSKLGFSQVLKCTKKEQNYLRRVIDAAKAGLKLD